MKPIITAILLGTLAASPALAEKAPQPGPADSRIRTVVYNPRDVVRVLGHYGFQTLIQFADYEQVENISIGDSLAWQVVPNERGNLLFVKPVEQNAQTNLTVVTSSPSTNAATGVAQRVYVFSLDAEAREEHTSPAFTWTVKFHYPEDAEQSMLLMQRRQDIANNAIIGNTGAVGGVDPSDWNFNYTFAGDTQQVPVKIFDNGTFTYFEFDNITDTPAIFLVDAQQNESLVNGVRQGRYVVVHRTARQFTLRNGTIVTCIFNENFTGEPALDQGSPVERSSYQRDKGVSERVARQETTASDADAPVAGR